MDALHRREYRIRDLPTRSVTLFPTRAQVVRDIKGLALKPGSNEITILGLTPSVDEDSIKVEGAGAAIISDIAVELIPNREIFQDIYPDSDSDEIDSDIDDDDDDHTIYMDNPALQAVRDKLTALRDEQCRADEVISSAETRLKILDSYGKTLDRKKGVDIEVVLENYRQERDKVFHYQMEGVVRNRELNKQIDELGREEAQIYKVHHKEQKKAEKAKARLWRGREREREKIRRRDAERLKEKARLRKEREAFWPRYCWCLRITLDAVKFTPTSSRRTSIASVDDLVKAVPEREATLSEDSALTTTSLSCDLSLNYVTSSAWWTPSYDLALTTTSNTGLLCFDAQLTNKTGENWSNCKVVLSTSQATFSGLQDELPTLVPWRLKLGAKQYGAKSDILNSREEKTKKEGWNAQQNAWGAQKSRNHLFGLTGSESLPHPAKPLVANAHAPVLPPPPPMFRSAAPAQESAPYSQFGVQQTEQQAHIASAFGQFAPGSIGSRRGAPSGSNANNSTLARASAFGGTSKLDSLAVKESHESARRVAKKKSVGGFFGRTSSVFGGRAEAAEEGLSERAGEVFVASAVEDEEQVADDGDTIMDRNPELSFQESSFEETGMTTTYDLPGLKSLSTSSTASKQRVARINFTNVSFSHTVVAKYKPVAYLKTKVRNASKLTLLKGAVGLTLDGSFMGRSTLPRCSAGDSFTMSLGVDPAIVVAYPKPEVKRSTTGLFNKEDSSVYSRTVTVSNTRAAAGKPVHLIVLDQMPVSEDDRLRVEILQPRGIMTGTNPGVSTGVPGKEGKDSLEWGKATATLKKAGEVSWDVVLNAGRSVKLALEYEVALPAGDYAIQC